MDYTKVNNVCSGATELTKEGRPRLRSRPTVTRWTAFLLFSTLTGTIFGAAFEIGKCPEATLVVQFISVGAESSVTLITEMKLAAYRGSEVRKRPVGA